MKILYVHRFCMHSNLAELQKGWVNRTILIESISYPSPKVVLGYKKTKNTKIFPKKYVQMKYKGSKNIVDPIISQFSFFLIQRVVIHLDVSHKILRPIVKELALYNLWFLSYSKKNLLFWPFFQKWPKIAVFWP